MKFKTDKTTLGNEILFLVEDGTSGYAGVVKRNGYAYASNWAKNGLCMQDDLGENGAGIMLGNLVAEGPVRVSVFGCLPDHFLRDAAERFTETNARILFQRKLYLNQDQLELIFEDNKLVDARVLK